MEKNIEIYVDDMVVKSKLESEHINDLGNIFGILRRHKLRFNVSKCSFSVGSRKFLEYMVTYREIEANPDQIKAINNLQPSRNPKEVQKLRGMTANETSRGIKRCLEHLMRHRGLQSVKNSYGTSEAMLSHVETRETNGFNSPKSKPHFSPRIRGEN